MCSYILLFIQIKADFRLINSILKNPTVTIIGYDLIFLIDLLVSLSCLKYYLS